MPDSLNEFGLMLAGFLPNLLAAILVLVIGWLVALLISKLVENLLRRTTLDDRLARALQGGTPERIPVERWISLAVFWLIMLFVIVLFLQTLNVGGLSEPLNGLLASVLTYIPKILAAAALLLLAWIIATVLRMIITRVLNSSVFTRRVTETAQMDTRNRVTIGQTIGNVVYWLVFLLFLPAVLDALDLQGILAPVAGMVDTILGALPNILGALLVLAIGWLVARIIRQIVTNLLAGIGIDRLGDRTGVNTALREQSLSGIIGTIVFVLIMIPVVIAALNVLDIPAVSQPAANMLNQLLNAIPAIFGAFLLLAVAYFVARLVGSLVTNLLAGIGFNRLFAPGGPIPVSGLSTGMPRTTPPDIDRPGGTDIPVTGAASTASAFPTGRTTPADIVGYIVMVAILLFAAMEASSMLGFESLTLLLSGFVVAAVNILFGLVIFGIGLFLANQAYRMIYNTGTTNAHILAQAARIAILVFSAALALRQMGIAESIVNLAFGLLLGAIAVAAALAFGLGGRDVAARLLERWRNEIREEANRPTPPPSPNRPTDMSGGTIITPGDNPQRE
jgi:hypothetical protein